MTPEQAEYLRNHAQCVLATGRKDGSPQVSTVNYSFDGEHILISVTSDRAKWYNAVRQPKVAMVVNDGRRQLVLYGTAEGIKPEHPDRIKLWRKHRALQAAMPPEVYDGRSRTPAPDDDAEYGRQLDELKRVLLRVTPETVFLNT